jgi:hypothetical protein
VPNKWHMMLLIIWWKIGLFPPITIHGYVQQCFPPYIPSPFDTRVQNYLVLHVWIVV